MSEILIGTSGFSYDDWKGAFYPPDMARKDFLEFYAGHFKALELNFSYYLEGISPFVEAGRLGVVLLQFPQSFHYTSENRIYLKSLIEALMPLPLAVEFRQREWLKESVYKTLQELGAGFVCVDEPSLPSLIPPIAISTSVTGYIRFHGRNSKDWYGTDSRTRYDYLYSEDELKEWVPKIRELAERTEKLFVFFNNHAKAQAVTNARMFADLLV